jgi:hypothetical protein
LEQTTPTMKASLLPLLALLSPAALANAAQIEQAPSPRAICEMKAGDAPIRLASQELVIRVSVYAGMELVGPQSCRNVAFYIPDRALSRRLQRLLKSKEDKKDYVSFYELLVDGVATYDAKEGRVRIDIDKMAGLPDV